MCFCLWGFFFGVDLLAISYRALTSPLVADSRPSLVVIGKKGPRFIGRRVTSATALVLLRSIHFQPRSRA